MGWLSIWGPSIAAVTIAAAFSWFANVYSEHQRRLGVRALISVELWHNLTHLHVLLADLNQSLQYRDPRQVIAAFLATATEMRWRRSRWDLGSVKE